MSTAEEGTTLRNYCLASSDIPRRAQQQEEAEDAWHLPGHLIQEFCSLARALHCNASFHFRGTVGEPDTLLVRQPTLVDELM